LKQDTKINGLELHKEWNVRGPVHKEELDNELKGMKIHIYIATETKKN
jgi:hypothetical protein